MRCFIAIPLPDLVLEALMALQREIPIGRKPPPENLHLTLAFMGELSETQAQVAHQALADIPALPFEVEIAGLDLFGGRKPEILFASVHPSDALSALHRKVVTALRSSGLDMPRERYRPHVTLARFNRAPAPSEFDRLAMFLQTHGLFAAPAFTVSSFTLFESILGHGPARHTALAEYPLGQIA